MNHWSALIRGFYLRSKISYSPLSRAPLAFFLLLDNNLLTVKKNTFVIMLICAVSFRKSFGENNVQTAKHYGNLGRLFQSMRKYKVIHRAS